MIIDKLIGANFRNVLNQKNLTNNLITEKLKPLNYTPISAGCLPKVHSLVQNLESVICLHRTSSRFILHLRKYSVLSWFQCSGTERKTFVLFTEYHYNEMQFSNHCCTRLTQLVGFLCLKTILVQPSHNFIEFTQHAIFFQQFWLSTYCNLIFTAGNNNNRSIVYMKEQYWFSLVLMS